MALPLKRSKHIRSVKELRQGYFQVLVPEFVLRKTDGGLSLDIKIADEMLSLNSGRGKQEFLNVARKHGSREKEAFLKSYEQFQNDDRLLGYRFDCADYPFRFANGGVLPIIRLDATDYFCLFYRDNFPTGWNIANGGSNTLEEVLNPEQVVLREFGEELIVADHDKQIIYKFDTVAAGVDPEAQHFALDAWQRRFLNGKQKNYTELPVPVKWFKGPDQLIVATGNRKETSQGYFLTIAAEDCSIEVDRVALIHLGGEISLFDGEIARGSLFNRPVGLFEVNEFDRQQKLNDRSFCPNKLFFDGKLVLDDQSGKRAERPSIAKLRKLIQDDYLPGIHNLRSAADRRDYEAERGKFDLCPITRSIIAQYFEKIHHAKSEPAADGLSEAAAKISNPHNCEVFVTFRQPDLQIARWLHQELTQRGHRVFCSSESLPRLGASDYCQEIDRALDDAKCLIVVGTRPDYLDSGWVAYEWRSFLNEVHSGRKPHGRLFTFTTNLPVKQLPFALRSVQNIDYRPSDPDTSFAELYRFLLPALR